MDRKNIEKKICRKAGSYQSLILYASLLLTAFNISGQTYSADIQKIIQEDTDLRNSTVEALHLYLINGDNSFSEVFSMRRDPQISIDSAVEMRNAL